MWVQFLTPKWNRSMAQQYLCSSMIHQFSWYFWEGTSNDTKTLCCRCCFMCVNSNCWIASILYFNSSIKPILSQQNPIWNYIRSVSKEWESECMENEYNQQLKTIIWFAYQMLVIAFHVSLFFCVCWRLFRFVLYFTRQGNKRFLHEISIMNCDCDVRVRKQNSTHRFFFFQQL